MKVSFIADTERLNFFGCYNPGWPILLTTLIKQATHNTVMNTDGEQVSQPTYYDADFDYSVANTSLISPIQQGNFDGNDFRVSPPIMSPSGIFPGLIRASQSEEYTVTMSRSPLEALQVGPDNGQMQTRYTIDASWNVLHTRSETSIVLDLQKNEYYPLRLVILGNGKDAKCVSDQTGPSGEKGLGLERTGVPRGAAKQEDTPVFM